MLRLGICESDLLGEMGCSQEKLIARDDGRRKLARVSNSQCRDRAMNILLAIPFSFND